ncbi:MAG: glycosyltransferase [Lachnospiraceae bacterium]|nr:glycosyltransferase [Lachnospiraceae bacterium]
MSTSIITVCFNSEKTILRTMESVLNQTRAPYEYIIVDGLSTDCTVAKAESMREAFENKNIALHIISEKDEGIYDAMNKGIEMAEGDIIGIINSDDFYEPEAVEVMEDTFKDTGCDLAFADIRMIMTNGRSFIKKARVRKYLTSRDWNHPTQFVSRKVYEKYRYKCRDISDDMELYFRVRKAGYKIVAVNQVLADFTMGGVSNRIPLKEIVPRIKRRYRIYRENGYSRFYIFECVAFELIKFVLA